MAEVRIVEVTDRLGNLTEAEWLARSEQTHRLLRPQIARDPGYVATMTRIFSQGGRLIVALNGDAVVGVAVWRCYENTFSGPFLYVDDLVTEETCRSTGIGHRLLAHCEIIAAQLGCGSVVLDSGVQRAKAHKFYFREGYSIGAYSFTKVLAPRATT